MKYFIDIDRTLGNTFWLTDVSPYYDRDINGKRGPNIEGYSYEIVLPDRGYDKLKVRIAGKQLMPSPADEDNGKVKVTFDGLDANPYVRDGWIQLSLKATGIKEATQRQDKPEGGLPSLDGKK